MARPVLSVETRTVTGKKVNRLRKEGFLPANIFGKDFKSTSIQVDSKEFQKTFKEAGEGALVDVKVGSEVHPALISNLQKDPKFDTVLHVDFHKVNLKEKITTNVAVVVEGESPVVKSGEGLLLQTLNEIEVECLPTEIPANITIDAEKLTEVGQAIHVKDLKVDEKVEVKNDPEEVVVTVQTAEMKEEEPEVEVSPEEVEATAEKGEEGAPEGGEAPTEAKGEEKSEG